MLGEGGDAGRGPPSFCLVSYRECLFRNAGCQYTMVLLHSCFFHSAPLKKTSTGRLCQSSFRKILYEQHTHVAIHKNSPVPPPPQWTKSPDTPEEIVRTIIVLNNGEIDMGSY